MTDYLTIAETVRAEQWTGSNADAIAALAGLQNMNLMAGNLTVFNKPVPPSAYVVMNTIDDEVASFREIVSEGDFSIRFTPDV